MVESEAIVFFTVDPKKETEKAFLGLTIATAALATEVKVRLFFALDGIYAATKGYLEGLGEEGFASLQELMDIFLEEGGEVFVCHPFMAKRNITEENLIEGAKLSAAPTLIYEALNAKIITIS
jgi:predicted peroxiredoxin